MDSKTANTIIYKLPMTREDILTALERVIPWSSDAKEHDGRTLTGHELSCIRDYVRKKHV